MKISDYIALYLEKRGVTHVYEVAGGMITFLLDSIQQRTKIKIISMHHEQAAAFAAEGFGRMTGNPGIALATSGPGATNLLTAIGSCYFDSVPAIFITGQVNRHEQKGKRAIRQLGFQETDIVAIAKPITKAAWLANDPQDIPRLLEEAFRLAVSGRPGPILIDVPMDVQRCDVSDISFLDLSKSPVKKSRTIGLNSYIGNLEADLKKAKRPLILAGGGIQASNCISSFRALIDILQIPVIYSLMAVDVLPYKHRLRVGLIGSYGNRWANIAMSQCDLLLVLGSRMDVRQTGADTDSFKGDRTIYHVDCEAGELNNRITGCRVLKADLSCFIRSLALMRSLPKWENWEVEIRNLKNSWPDTTELKEVDGINPNIFMLWDRHYQSR